MYQSELKSLLLSRSLSLGVDIAIRVQLLEWIHSFPTCMFVLRSDKDQRKFLLSLSLKYNSTLSN